jgi:hypothetical protein
MPLKFEKSILVKQRIPDFGKWRKLYKLKVFHGSYIRHCRIIRKPFVKKSFWFRTLFSGKGSRFPPPKFFFKNLLTKSAAGLMQVIRWTMDFGSASGRAVYPFLLSFRCVGIPACSDKNPLFSRVRALSIRFASGSTFARPCSPEALRQAEPLAFQ